MITREKPLPWPTNRPPKDGLSPIPTQVLHASTPLQEAVFVQMLRLERRRSERSGRPFMLVLISGNNFRATPGPTLVKKIVEAVSAKKRDTDILGWYQGDETLGLLLTEIGSAEAATTNAIRQKLSDAIAGAASFHPACQVTMAFHVFPQRTTDLVNRDLVSIFYPERSNSRQCERRGGALKRLIDIIGSLIGLVIFLPIFILIAVLVKLTSRGPVLFCQKRVGQRGKEFNFLKFRTMYVDNDSQIHEEYISKLIAGTPEAASNRGVYKLTHDPRVTPLGRLLRKSSLDELPQFVNVLRNDMSLVGPRPPLPYEYARYQIWHRRRVLELKPGLTGLWQVDGRSRTTFDEMVRMDLRYAKTKSLWIDFMILLRTPLAMISGRGAC